MKTVFACFMFIGALVPLISGVADASEDEKFEYKVVTAQGTKATWDNGRWLGSMPITEYSVVPEATLNSCPEVWTYLNELGESGWELVNGSQQFINITLYLKKSISDDNGLKLDAAAPAQPTSKDEG